MNQADLLMDDWRGCYGEGWRGVIIPEAFAHPAKFSRALIRRIYEHMLEEGWVQAGDTILDPFGGVALGAWPALRLGLDWVGVELEQKFVDLGNQNIALWCERYGQRLPRWGRAALLQGDSRRLGEVIGEVFGPVAQGHGPGAMVSSPPYAKSATKGSRENRAINLEQAGINSKKWLGRRRCTQGRSEGYGTHPAQLGNMPEGEFDACVTSPPFGEGETRDRSPVQGGEIADAITRAYTQDRQGTTEGNLAHLRAEAGDLAACVSSPPYAGSATEKNSAGIDWEKQYETYKSQGGGMSYEAFVAQQLRHMEGYGSSDGQLAAMPEGRFEGAVSSPPYEASVVGSTEYEQRMKRLCAQPIESLAPRWRREVRKYLRTKARTSHCQLTDGGYGNATGQLGERQGDTFWSAARDIVQQVYQVLTPGAPAVWVVKSFVRNKKRVNFPKQWMELCEACGFEAVHWHCAHLVEDRGSQFDLFGELHENKVERKSFFRRLAERKGSPRIDWEVVLCTMKR